MHDNEVYKLTPRGQQELLGGETTLSPAEIELLIRVDGLLSVAQIRAGMPAVAPEVFSAKLGSLLDRRMLSPAEPDPFTEQFNIQLNQVALSSAEAEGDAGAASLKKAGYYVSIARPRGSARSLTPGEVLSAIVVDDEPMLAKFIQSYLSFEGFQVRLAGNRAEVVAEFRKQPVPDLILLDVMLPDADGFDILLRLRQHPALKNVPVIMLTGKATRESVIKGLASGADGYVTKPFEADTLMRAVRTVMGLPDPAKAPADLWVDKQPR